MKQRMAEQAGSAGARSRAATAHGAPGRLRQLRPDASRGLASPGSAGFLVGRRSRSRGARPRRRRRHPGGADRRRLSRGAARGRCRGRRRGDRPARRDLPGGARGRQGRVRREAADARRRRGAHAWPRRSSAPGACCRSGTTSAIIRSPGTPASASPRGELGELRYLAGNFSGFKRARKDVGCTANDAVHFLDLFNWLLGAAPLEAFAIQRDHFGRGLEDLSLILLTYPSGALAKVRDRLHPARPSAGQRRRRRAHDQGDRGVRQRRRARRSTTRPSASSGTGCATSCTRTASGARCSGTRSCPSSSRAVRSRC